LQNKIAKACDSDLKIDFVPKIKWLIVEIKAKLKILVVYFINKKKWEKYKVLIITKLGVSFVWQKSYLITEQEQLCLTQA